MFYSSSNNKPFYVFISSVMAELLKLRSSVFYGLKNLDYEPFVFELTGIASANNALVASLDEVEESDFFVAIFTERLGDVTEEEYYHAKKLGMPIFVFIDKDSIPQPRLKSFLEQEFRDPRGDEPTPYYFSYKDNLVTTFIAR